MLKKYTTDDYWKLYEDLSPKIQNLFWENDIDNRIEKIAERFQLGENKKEKVIQIIAHLFFGVLPLSQIKTAVEKEIALESTENEKLSKEIVRFIIYPVQHILREVHEEEEFKKIGVRSNFHEEDKPEKEKTTDFGDIYREPIE